MSKNLSVQWTQGVRSDAEKKRLEEAIRHSTTALGRLKEILEEDLRGLRAVPEAQYDKASWPFYQADKNGEIRRLTKILALLSFLEN